MKYTHNALTSITVQKVENITTSMTRAGVGDDTYRRQRQKERYERAKVLQAQKEEQMRQEFMQKREQKLKHGQAITAKKNEKRKNKKERQRQLKKKMKFLKQIQGIAENSSDNNQNEDSQKAIQNENSNEVHQHGQQSYGPETDQRNDQKEANQQQK